MAKHRDRDDIRLIHGYDAVDMEILWQTLRQDLPPLIAALERILGLVPDARGRERTVQNLTPKAGE